MHEKAQRLADLCFGIGIGIAIGIEIGFDPDSDTNSDPDGSNRASLLGRSTSGGRGRMVET